jgi:hypothetical protein
MKGGKAMFNGIKKKLAVIGAIAASIVMMPFTVLASVPNGASIDVSGVVTSGVTEVSGQIFGVIGAVLPIAMGVVGAVIAITFAIRFIRRMMGG